MPAAPASAIATALIRIGGGGAPEGPPVHPLVRALGPALETAFGLEHEAVFPDEIQALVAALLGGPLGDAIASRETGPAERCLEPA